MKILIAALALIISGIIMRGNDILVYTGCIVSFMVGLMVLLKRWRFYVYSYFFPWLYEHPKVSKLLGIEYENDEEWHTNRKETSIYMDGIYVGLTTMVTGMSFILPDDVRKEFMRYQKEFAGQIDMRRYFDQINGKTMKVIDFEHFLSNAVLKETNRVFQVVDEKTEEEFSKHLWTVRVIMNGLTGSLIEGFRKFMVVPYAIYKISKILKSVPQHKRLVLHVPQLALIHNFSKCIIKTKGDMSDIEPYTFLDPISKFFILLRNGNLIFVHRHDDKKNTETNRAFGPYGLQCPGNIYSLEFIRSILTFLKSFNIKVEGDPIYRGSRFKKIINKDKIMVTFNKKNIIE